MIDKDQILQLIKESVKATAPEATLILYGSYARGDYNDESDIDLLILVDQEKVTHNDRVKIAYPLYDIQFKEGILISPKIVTKTHWEKMRRMSPFYYNVTSEGVML